MVERNNGLTWTRYTHDGNDVVLDDNNDILLYYGNGTGIDDKLWRWSDNAQTTVYFLKDYLGSTRGLMTADGQLLGEISYDSFGKPLGTNVDSFGTRYLYTGREYDADTELYYYRARWYDPEARRFISEDPIGLNGGINLYAYVGNNPIGKLRKPRTLRYSLDKMLIYLGWGRIIIRPYIFCLGRKP